MFDKFLIMFKESCYTILEVEKMIKHAVQAWMKDGIISIPSFLFQFYKKIGLTDQECFFLLNVYSFIKNGNEFPTPDELSEQMTIDVEQCSMLLRALIKRGYMKIEHYNQEGIYGERYSLDPLWERLLQQYINQQELQTSYMQNESIYTIFEKEFGRPLSPFECETLAMWLDDDQHSTEIVVAALKEAVISGKLNFRYIDRILFEWKKNGIKTVAQAKDYGKKFRMNQKREKVSETKTNVHDVPFYNWLES